MTLGELIAQDAERVFANADELGELTEYRDSSANSKRFAAVWLDGDPVDAGFGVQAIQRFVHVPAALCVDAFDDPIVPRKGGQLIRRPEQEAQGLDEIWVVLTVTLEAAMHVCVCQKGA